MKRMIATVAMLTLFCAPAAFAQSAASETTVSKSVDENGVSVKRTEKSVDQDGATLERSRSVKAAPDGSVQVKRTQKATDGMGGEVERSKTYTNDPSEKKVTTTSRTKNPDGSEESSHTERTVTPK